MDDAPADSELTGPDQPNGDAVAGEPAERGTEHFGPQLVAPPAAVAASRGRHAVAAGAARSNSWSQDPGLALLGGSLALVLGALLAVVVSWVALLVVVALIQVLFARAWTHYLEVPAAKLMAVAVLVVAAVADAGIVVSRLIDDSDVASSELVPLAPALGTCFLVAVLAQLIRRDDRAGTLAGLVAVTTGGAFVIGLAVWLPLEGSPAGGRWVAAGIAAVGIVGVLFGATGWVRQGRAPSPALLLPTLLALFAGPFYVLGRIVAG